MATIGQVINLIQDINRSVTGIKLAPDFDNYRFSPEDRFQVPFVITLKKKGTWGSSLNNGKYVDDYEITVLQEAVAQNEFRINFADTHNLLQAFRDKYLDDATYQLPSDGIHKILSNSPKVWILDGNKDAFTDTGHSIIEYPDKLGKFYWGFKINFTIGSSSQVC